MSTRSHIEFVWEEEKITHLIYRHSDGYPTGLIPDLLAFLKWNSGRNSDVEYTIANYFFFEKVTTIQMLNECSHKTDNPDTLENMLDASTAQLGYGLCEPKGIHGDCEWFYRVTFRKAGHIDIDVYKMKFDMEYKDINEDCHCGVLIISDPQTYEVKEELLSLMEKNGSIAYA